MDKLKIGYVLDDTLDTPDGVQQYVLSVGKYMASRGHEVHYLVGNTKRTDIENIHSLSRNVKVKFNQNKLSIPLPANAKNIKDLLVKENFDVLHVQMPYSPALAAKIINNAPKNTAVVGTFHVAPYNRYILFGNKLLGLIVKRSLKRFDSIISVSMPASDLALQAFKVKSVIIPNTVDLSEFFNVKPERDGKLSIVFLGRLVPRKGCQYLLKAIKKLYDSNILGNDTWQVIICGGGELRNSLEDYCRTNGLTENVRFAGFISEDSKPQYLADSDIAIYPSTGGESFGIVLLEAMAASRGAVLAGNNWGYSAVLAGHEENLFDPKNTDELFNLLVRVLKDDTFREKSHLWQLQLAAKYDISLVGLEIEKVYIEALRKH